MNGSNERGTRPDKGAGEELRAEKMTDGGPQGKVHKEQDSGHRRMPPKVRRGVFGGLTLKDLPKVLSDAFSRMRGALSRFEIGKKAAMIGFCVLALISVTVCTFLGYSYSGYSIRAVSQMTESSRSSYKAYRIVYSEADSFGLDAAKDLQAQFLTKTGASLNIVPDTEAVGKHEIRIGHTNRATDDYITSASTLGNDGYAVIISSGDNVDLLAFSETGANAAVKFFINSYVGAYRAGEIVFATKMNFSFASRTGEEPVSTLRESKVTLDFSEDGRFKILVLSDPDINPNTISAIENILDVKAPDLVVFCGDVSSGMTTKADLSAYLEVLSAPLESRKIPWTAIFGEQDTDGGLSADSQVEVYSSFEYCLVKKEISSGGAVSYFLPIYENGGGASSTVPVFGIWAMGQTSMLSLSGGGAASDPVLSGDRESGTDYGYVPTSHVAFFTENTRVLARESGGYLPTVVITHTPIQEFSVIAENPGPTGLSGNVGEQVSSSPINSGLFASLVEAGNVLGLYAGHDHLNSYSGRYCGIELGYSASIGFDGYGLGGTFEINNKLRGGRMIDLTLKNGEVISSSYMVYASECAPKTEEE